MPDRQLSSTSPSACAAGFCEWHYFVLNHSCQACGVDAASGVPMYNYHNDDMSGGDTACAVHCQLADLVLPGPAYVVVGGGAYPEGQVPVGSAVRVECDAALAVPVVGEEYDVRRNVTNTLPPSQASHLQGQGPRSSLLPPPSPSLPPCFSLPSPCPRLSLVRPSALSTALLVRWSVRTIMLSRICLAISQRTRVRTCLSASCAAPLLCVCTAVASSSAQSN
jgi:hypothetical protein